MLISTNTVYLFLIIYFVLLFALSFSKVHKEELQHLETKHGPLPSDTEDQLEGNNSDVQIESEEVIVTENGENLTENPKISAAEGENGPGKATPDVKSKGDNENESAKGEKFAAKGEKSDAKGEKSAAKGNKSPNKALQRYHNLSDVLSGGSPVAKKLFSAGGSEEEMFEQAKKLLVRTGKVSLTSTLKSFKNAKKEN